jgi:hypothetical protein
VPVYLDGDTPSAQKHGETFGVNGYPTMILFRSDGKEITRLPGGVDVTRYATILDVALADARPVSELLAAQRKGDVLSHNDWRLLAYHSWVTDAGHTLPEAERIATFRQLSARCPVELEADCTRLFFEYLYSAAAVAGEGGEPFSGSSARKHARGCWRGLASPRWCRPTCRTCPMAPPTPSVCCRTRVPRNAAT